MDPMRIGRFIKVTELCSREKKEEDRTKQENLIKEFISSKDAMEKRHAGARKMKKQENKNTKEFEKVKKEIVKILKKHHIKKAGIFGSYARGEEGKRSDVDILVDFNGSLLSLVRIERELKENVGKKIDLLTYKGIHPLLKKRILKEEVKILR